MIIDALPDQLKLPFYLWTRAAVVSLIEREYEIAVSLTTVGRYLKSWGMSPQLLTPSGQMRKSALQPSGFVSTRNSRRQPAGSRP
jgi:transposase